MAKVVKHAKVLNRVDPANPGVVLPQDWDAEHVIVGNDGIADITGLQSALTALTNSVTAEANARAAAVSAEEAARIADVNAEEAARIAAVSGEASARTSADNALGTRIDNEIAARTSGDSTNANAIAAEITNRTNADNAVTAAMTALVNNEANARIAADNAEVTNRNAAIAAEALLRTNADTAEATARANADTAEQNARIAAVASEASTRAAADTAEQNARIAAVAAEATARIIEDNALRDLIDDEGGLRQDEDEALLALINTEASVREDADTNEADARELGDLLLGNRIDAEVDDRTDEVARLDARIDNEIGGIGGDVSALTIALSQEIANRIADVNAEEASRIAADAAEQTARITADNRIERIGLLHSGSYRPGIDPKRFSKAAIGLPATVGANTYLDSDVQTLNGDPVLYMTGDGNNTVATVDMFPYDATKYELFTFRFRRLVDPPNAAINSGAVRVGFYFINEAGVSNGSPILLNLLNRTVAAGVQEVSYLFGPTDVVGYDNQDRPAGYFIRPFAQAYGTGQNTALIEIRREDVTRSMRVALDLVAEANTRAADDTTERLTRIAEDTSDRTAAASASVIAAENDFEKLDWNEQDAVLAVADAVGRSPFYVRADGSMSRGPVFEEVIYHTNYELIDGVSDMSGRLMFGHDMFGRYYEGSTYSDEIPENDLEIIHAIGDADGRMVVAFDSYGGQYAGTSYSYDTQSNNLDLVFAYTDASGRVLFGYDIFGGSYEGGLRYEAIGDNNLKLVIGVVDENNNVGFGVTEDGEVIGNLSSADNLEDIGAIVWEQSGDIFGLLGDEEIQITDTGNNSRPRIGSNNRVYFISSRMGSPHTFEADYADGATARVWYNTRRAYEGVIGTGQSLMVGNENAGITTTQNYPGYAFKFTNGPIAVGTGDPGSGIVPCVERSSAETISTSFTRQFLSIAQDRKLLMFGAAQGGQPYSTLRKGGSTGVFENIINQIVDAQALPGGVHVRAINLIHGEADGLNQNASYDANLRTWLDDFNADGRAAAGNQKDRIVFLMCQCSSAAGYRGLSTSPNRDTFYSPFLQTKACYENDDMFMVGPKYHLDYNDNAHLNAVSTRIWGEQYAKVYRSVVDTGFWHPLWVKRNGSNYDITVSGNDVIINLDVPVAPIVFDTTIVSDPGNYGFNLRNAGGRTITNVAITGPAQITVTLSSAPVAGVVLSYAFHNGDDGGLGAGVVSGRLTGCRGCVRDSDTTQSKYTSDYLRNWLCAFKHTF